MNDFRHFPRKRFGQHWLKDQGVLDQIVNAANLNADDCVLEIGPGKGALTEKLIASKAKFIQAIEEEGSKCGMKLNKTKCELVTSERNPNIHFADGPKVKNKDEAKYLGCLLNKDCRIRTEVSKIISNYG